LIILEEEDIKIECYASYRNL